MVLPRTSSAQILAAFTPQALAPSPCLCLLPPWRLPKNSPAAAESPALPAPTLLAPGQGAQPWGQARHFKLLSLFPSLPLAAVNPLFH